MDVNNPFSFRIVPEDELPPITPEQRAALIQAVRKGILPFSPKLMARAGVTAEECATPYARFREDLYKELAEKGYNVTDWSKVIGAVAPADKFLMDVVDLATSYGYDKSEVLDKIAKSAKLHAQINKIRELGNSVKVTAEDLYFMNEEDEDGHR